MFIRLTIFCLLQVWLPSQLFACRYTVRDIGFAALRSHEYALVLSWRSTGDDEIDSERANIAEEWSQALKPLLAGSNVTILIDQSRAGEMDELGSQHSDLTTRLEDKTNQRSRAIGIELTNAQGSSILLPSPLESLSEPPEFAQWLDRNVFLPVLERISRESLESFAHLLVIEGDNSNENDRIHQLADQALAAVRRLEPLLPRPISFPLRKLVVHPDGSSQSVLLRRMLGSDATDSGARLAVVYGRGRLAGPVMQGSRLTMQEVLAQLALVGQSCECETDRGWLEEPSLPFRWDASTRRRASSYLGFDPDSPLVRAEMLRIVSQGPRSPRTNKQEANTDSPDAIARMLLGYSETRLDIANDLGGSSVTAYDDSKDVESTIAFHAEDLGRPTGVQATVIAGDGWGFEPTVAERVMAENQQTTSEAGTAEFAAQHTEVRPEESEAVPTANHDVPNNSTGLDGVNDESSIPSMAVITLATIVGVPLLVIFVWVLRSK